MIIIIITRDDGSSCYALKPRVESELDVVSGWNTSVDADPTCLMRITYGDESGILGHAERHIICSGKKQGISISVSRLMYNICLHIHMISIHRGVFMYIYLNWVLINFILLTLKVNLHGSLFLYQTEVWMTFRRKAKNADDLQHDNLCRVLLGYFVSFHHLLDHPLDFLKRGGAGPPCSTYRRLHPKTHQSCHGIGVQQR